MITTWFRAQIGTGLRQRIVAVAAHSTGKKICVVSHVRELSEQFKRILPEAECITVMDFLKKEETYFQLLIVDEMPNWQFDKIGKILKQSHYEVWVIESGAI